MTRHTTNVTRRRAAAASQRLGKSCDGALLRRARTDVRANFQTEQGGRMLIEVRASQGVTNGIARIEPCDAVGAIFEVAFKFDSTSGA
jgi:hypothetical protein